MTSHPSAVNSIVEHPVLVSYVNRKYWWHVPPSDPNAYAYRGKFFASSYREAEFYGRPENEPTRVNIFNPLVGDEATILVALFGDQDRLGDLGAKDGLEFIEARHRLDSAMKTRAEELGYDAIILMTPTGHAQYVRSGKIPRSLELNML
jgi:hypothetical protein